MSRPRSKHTPSEPTRRGREETQVPVVLPHVVMDVAADGRMTVAVDGQPHEPEPFAPPWRREDFAAILDQLTDQRRSPVRVEVRETDGGMFTDIITPGKRSRPEPEAGVESSAPVRVGSEFLVLTGEGFVPGEDVAIAVVLAHADAAHDGTARATVTADQLAASPTREVILLGRVSGILTVGHPA